VCLSCREVLPAPIDLTIANVYSIKNVGETKSRLFFSQAVEEGVRVDEQKENDD
jgi:hypothetical protein